MPDWISIVLIGYLLGSIPFSYVITRLRTGKDIRAIGSGNVGATNVWRTTGKFPALLALMLDTGKGMSAVWIGGKIGGTEAAAGIAGVSAMIGHSWPIFLGFRGGKSVATGGGAFFVLSPLAIFGSIGLFALVLGAFRMVSLGSITASAAFPLFAWLFGAHRDVVLWGSLGAALIIWRHKENVSRLVQGTEEKIGKK